MARAQKTRPSEPRRATTRQRARGRPSKQPVDIRTNSSRAQIALREFSNGSLGEITEESRKEIIGLFEFWPRHDKNIVLSDGDWKALEDERRRCLESLVMEMKCPPLDFFVKFLSTPDLDRDEEIGRELVRRVAVGGATGFFEPARDGARNGTNNGTSSPTRQTTFRLSAFL